MLKGFETMAEAEFELAGIRGWPDARVVSVFDVEGRPTPSGSYCIELAPGSRPTGPTVGGWAPISYWVSPTYLGDDGDAVGPMG